jgi:hypothetical protein
VVGEFALAIVLLVGAGLFVRSWWSANRIDPGLRAERVFVMELSAPTTFSDPALRLDLYDRVLEEVRAVPGVENAERATRTGSGSQAGEVHALPQIHETLAVHSAT